MDKYRDTCPLSQQQLLDEFFIEYRAQVLAVAAYLDRLDRSVDRNAADDFRHRAFLAAVAELASDAPGRAERIQMIFSDPRLALLDERDRQGAFGAYDNPSITQSHGDGQ